MARRMFSPQIVDSDAFLDMSASAQNLYFHLGMRADDDGFVGNPKKILRMVGGNDDDLKILLAKRFILTFENGVIVIKHWRINNLVRKDWYRPTQYLEQKNKLFLKKNGAYTEDYTQGESLVNELTPSSSTQVRLGKVRLGKEENLSHSINYLTNIPLEDMKEFKERFDAGERQIKNVAENLLLYCQAHAKVYKNYKAFLLNALKKDLTERQPRKISQLEPELKLTPEQKQKIEEEKEAIRKSMLIKK